MNTQTNKTIRWTKQTREYTEIMDSPLCYTATPGHESWPGLQLIYSVTLQKLILVSQQISTENIFLVKGETFSVLIHLSVLVWIVCWTCEVLVHDVKVLWSSQVYHFFFLFPKDVVFFRVIHHLQLLLFFQNIFHNDS